MLRHHELHVPVSINNYLATGKTGIAMRSANNEFSRGLTRSFMSSLKSFCILDGRDFNTLGSEYYEDHHVFFSAWLFQQLSLKHEIYF